MYPNLTTLVFLLVVGCSLGSKANVKKKPVLCENEYGKILLVKTPNIYGVSDPANPQFRGIARVEKQTLKFTFHFKASEDERSDVLRGQDQFREILDHFDGKFTRIQGQWIQTPFMTSDNLSKLNELTGPPTNESLENAAEKTWTGRQALAAGYTKVRRGRVEGKAGKYESVTVYFEKP